MSSSFWKKILQAGGNSASARARRFSRRDNRALKSAESSGAYTRGGLVSVEDLEIAGMFDCGPIGIPIGVFDGRMIYENSDQPVNFIAGPGTGKTACGGFAIMAEWQGSSLTIDIDGQYSQGVMPFRQQLGHTTVLLSPHGLYGMTGLRWNFFQPVISAVRREDMQAAIELARDNAVLLVPDTPDQNGNPNNWIDMAAREILAAAILYLAKDRPEDCNPGSLFEFLMRPINTALDELGLNASEVYVLRRVTKLVSELGTGAEKQLEWKFEKACEPLALFEPGSTYDRATSASDFDPALAKSGDRPLDICILFDGTKLESGAAYISLTLSSLIEVIAGAAGNRHTLVLADEFSQCPKSRTLIKCMRAYRKRLIRVVTMSQSRQATADRYGVTLQKDIEAMAGANIWFSPDYEVAKELSEKSGTKTILSRGMRDDQLAASPAGKNVSEVSAPNLHVAELCFDGGETKNKAIIEVKKLPGLLVTEKLGWWEIYPYAEQLSDAYLDDSNRHAQNTTPDITLVGAMGLFGFDEPFTRQDLDARAAMLSGRFDPGLLRAACALLEETL
ncbi:MAG: type IV secretory system conjugative DNA transfer family protein [Rhodobacteraceae bacterium]|nr:type IV secretory system conjugative DNA transfer family protein [Paracoccaceae bacterium]